MIYTAIKSRRNHGTLGRVTKPFISPLTTWQQSVDAGLPISSACHTRLQKKTKDLLHTKLNKLS